MYILSNNYLTVQILDPEKNRDLLGSRYCTGGYIHQIIDAKIGNLLSGPGFPDPDVDVFDGQGAPEVFTASPNSERAKVGDDVLVIGVGFVTRTSDIEPFHSRNNPHVREFCTWNTIHQLPDSLCMQTTQCIDKITLTLTRIITLNNRSVTSATVLKNSIAFPIPLQWFAHPFFPVPANNRLHSFLHELELPENSGYMLDNNGFIVRNTTHDWEKGLYQLITLKNNELLHAQQFHNDLGTVKIHGDFSPDALAIWGNDKTCSFEPFIMQQIKPQQTCSWSITYSF
jgi:hypothetical protein